MADEPSSEISQDKAKESSVFFRGTVARVTFRNHETGFAVIKAEPDYDIKDLQNASENPIAVVGVFPNTMDSGTYFIARGEWQTHAKFGRQFRAFSVTEAEPAGAEAIARYLGSGAIKGFGPVLAKRVVGYFGDETLQVIDETPERLKEVPGIAEKKLGEILSSWREKRSLRDVLLFFESHKISLSLAQRIYNTYGDKTIEITKRNPYVLAKDIWGIGFQTADRIAQALGISLTSIERVLAGIVYSLERATDDGHCYLPFAELLKKSATLLDIEDSELLEDGLRQACLEGELVLDENDAYLPQLHLDEKQLARCIAGRIAENETFNPRISEDIVQSICSQPQEANTAQMNSADTPGGGKSKIIHLSEQQQHAVSLAAKSSLLVITGGPGCGKTTVVRSITKLFQRAGLDIKLAAPTGRAAQRLAEVCGLPASTIHRLLKFDPMSRSFQHDEHNPLELDVLIVDESSMIDISLATHLMRAVDQKARIVFVGDADQLPSVGPGLFLADLLNTREVPRIRLTTLFRRADESLITTVAHKVNAAIIPKIPEPDGTIKTDAYFLPAEDAEAAAQLIERLSVEQIPKKFGFSTNDITVLSPMNKGPLGVIALNQRLQERLVPNIPGLPHVKVGNLEFRLGDKVCQRVNNYNLHSNGVFNGEQGEIVGIDAETKSIYVNLWDGREIKYPSESLYQLDLAYALTIHRSQGSEVPVVLLAMHSSHAIMLERQLLYTGITRAKQLLVIVGTKKALAIATKRSRSKRRYTRLCARTTEMLDI